MQAQHKALGVDGARETRRRGRESTSSRQLTLLINDLLLCGGKMHCREPRYDTKIAAIRAPAAKHCVCEIQTWHLHGLFMHIHSS